MKDTEVCKVYIAHLHSTKEKYTAKTFSKNLIVSNPDLIEKVRNEVEVYREYHHEHIAKLYEVFEDHLAVTLVFEYVEGPSIEKIYRVPLKYRTRDLTSFLLYIIEAIDFLHGNNIVHRDIYPSNVILRSSGRIGEINPPILVGLSNFAKLDQKDNTNKPVVGRFGYIAPELLQDNIHKTTIDLYKVDIFAVGLLLYCLITNEEPYKNESHRS